MVDNEKLQCAADVRREAMEEPSDEERCTCSAPPVRPCGPNCQYPLSDEERWPNGVVGMPVKEVAVETVKAIKAAECQECGDSGYYEFFSETTSSYGQEPCPSCGGD